MWILRCSNSAVYLCYFIILFHFRVNWINQMISLLTLDPNIYVYQWFHLSLFDNTDTAIWYNVIWRLFAILTLLSLLHEVHEVSSTIPHADNIPSNRVADVGHMQLVTTVSAYRYAGKQIPIGCKWYVAEHKRNLQCVKLEVMMLCASKEECCSHNNICNSVWWFISSLWYTHRIMYGLQTFYYSRGDSSMIFTSNDVAVGNHWPSIILCLIRYLVSWWSTQTC